MKKILCVLAACLFLTGCLATVDPNNFQQVAAAVRGDYSPYQKTYTIRGPEVMIGSVMDLRGSYFMRAFTAPEKKRVTSFQIYVQARFPEWAFLDRAYSEGKNYDVTEISRDVGQCSTYGCTVWEDVGINLTYGQIQKIIKNQGFMVQVRGNRGEISFFVPRTYFEAFLQSCKDNGMTF